MSSADIITAVINIIHITINANKSTVSSGLELCKNLRLHVGVTNDDHYNDQNDPFLDSDHDDDHDDDHASHQSAGAKWPQPQQELGIAGPSGTLTLNSALL